MNFAENLRRGVFGFEPENRTDLFKEKRMYTDLFSHTLELFLVGRHFRNCNKQQLS